MVSYEQDGLPIEEFIQALQSQLDRAQATMAVKARFGLPLTFAVKEISIDLRAHISMNRNRVMIHPAGPMDSDASVIHLALTTITRPMIEENTFQFEPEDVPLTSVLQDEFDEEEQRRLEWAGIRTVSQLRELQKQGSEHIIEQVAQIPALRLRRALEKASMPHISEIGKRADGRLHIRGLNLMDSREPEVMIGGELVALESANERELVVSPLAYPVSGMLSVRTAEDKVTERPIDAAVASWNEQRTTADPHSELQYRWQHRKLADGRGE